MTLQSAAAILNSDLQALQARAVQSGWPMRATVLGTGLSGPRGRATGVYVRLRTADGEEYVFTVTGNQTRIEEAISNGHEVATRALARESWPTPSGEMLFGPAPEATSEGAYRSLARPRGAGYFTPRLGVQDARHEGSPEVGFDSQESNPRNRRREERSLLHRHTFSIQRRPDGLWTACVCIPTDGGPVYLCATADEHAVAQALQNELAIVSGGRSWVGSDEYRAACGQTAEARAEDRLGGAVRSFVNDPGAQALFSAMPVVPVVGPIASLAFHGTRAAVQAVDAARAGDPKARAGIARISAAAKRGDRRAIAAFNALKQAKALRDGKADPKSVEQLRRIAALEAENRNLTEKLKAMEAKWGETPLEATDEFLDQWGGSDDFVGPDIVQAAGNVVGAYAEEIGVGRDLARPMVARYFRNRLPVGPVRHECSPEVAGLYHRPMRESSTASLRKDYLRGSALEIADFQNVSRRYLAWPVSPSAAASAVVTRR